jgi:hypothetical protein
MLPFTTLNTLKNRVCIVHFENLNPSSCLRSLKAYTRVFADVKCLYSSILKICNRVLSWMKCHDATKIQNSSVPHKLTPDWFNFKFEVFLNFYTGKSITCFGTIGYQACCHAKNSSLILYMVCHPQLEIHIINICYIRGFACVMEVKFPRKTIYIWRLTC